MTLKQENRRLSRRLAVIALGMFGFAFALVPFYNQICAALGINERNGMKVALDRAKKEGVDLRLPVDCVSATKFEEGAPALGEAFAKLEAGSPKGAAASA